MKKGETAPEFVLKNTNGDEVTLHDLTKDGKALLLFFPLAFSNVCTDEACKVKDNMKMYNAMNVQVAGISVDSFFTLNEFKKTHNLNFTLLSDFNKEVSSKYNVLYEDYFGMKGVSKRAALLINQNHKIEYAEILDDSGKLPDFKAIQKEIIKE